VLSRGFAREIYLSNMYISKHEDNDVDKTTEVES